VTLLELLDFIILVMIDGIPDGKPLEKRGGLKGDFRLVKLNGLFPVNLAVKNPVFFPDLKDPLHNGVHTSDTNPSLPPGGFAVFLISPQSTQRKIFLSFSVPLYLCGNSFLKIKEQNYTYCHSEPRTCHCEC